MRHLLVSALVLAVVTVSAQQQPAPPKATDPSQPLTFKVEVNYVEIDATVTDPQGNAVHDLTRNDFEIFEEGRRQAVTVFTRVELPVERADPLLFRAAAVEPDVRSNRREFDGRVFVIILDELHTSMTRTVRLRAAATQFIERYLGANDIAAILHTGGTKAGSQEFTGNRAALLRTVNQFVGNKLPSAAIERQQDAFLAARAQLPGNPADRINPSESERAYKARRMLGTLKGVADYLSGVRGRRKAVVLFSEGIDYDVNNGIDNRYAVDIIGEFRSAIGAAGRANVSFYTIDPRGLTGMDIANGIPTARADEPLQDVLPGAPTVVREFSRADRLSLFAEVYDSIRPPHRVEIKTTLTADDGTVAYTHADTRDSSELKARGDGFGHVRAIPLNGVAPGRYVLRVEARPSVSGTQPMFRELELVFR